MPDVSTAEVQQRTTPEQVLELLRAGNERFARGLRTERDRLYEIRATAEGQAPLAVVLGCMDSRVAVEVVFDAGLGDMFIIRVAGNVVSTEALGSMEFGCGVAGAKLVLVLGHKQCGAVTACIDMLAGGDDPDSHPEHENLGAITGPIAACIAAETETVEDRSGKNTAFVDHVAELNVRRSMRVIRERSPSLRALIDSGRVMLVGGVYDVASGRVEFLDADA